MVEGSGIGRRDWLLRRLRLLRLTPFPSACRGGPSEITTKQRVESSTFFVLHHYSPQTSLRVIVLRDRGLRDGLATTQTASASLNAFPFRLPRGPSEITTKQRVELSTVFCFTPLFPANKFACYSAIKQRDVEKIDISLFRCYFAEREGFEPPVQLPVHRISSAARSTTPASFPDSACKYRNYFSKK